MFVDHFKLNIMDSVLSPIIAGILIIFGVFQIILFVKIWIMTNDVKKMTTKYLSTHKYRIGDIVCLKGSQEAMTIDRITYDNKFVCYKNSHESFSNSKSEYVGNFLEEELDLL